MFLYLIYLIISPILWIILRILGLFNRKIGQHLQNESKTWLEAFKKIQTSKGDRKLILFHSASAGEFEQLKPILRRIDRKKYFVLQTFFSPTIYEKEKNSNLLDAVCYQPLDFPWSVIRFLIRFNPDIYVITRHDVWPNHIYFSKLFGIKTYLVNGNLYEESNRLRFPLKSFNRWVYNNFDMILTGSERLSQNFQKLVSYNKIIVTGDTRFDQIIERKEKNNHNHFPKEINDSQNIIFGSIIDSDFEIIFDAIQQYYPKGDSSLTKQNNRLIIVPHEIDEKTIIEIESQLNKLNISSQRFTKLSSNLNANVIIIDVVGILADLYAYADIAYIGAGFGAGVHSVIEPAVYGCAVSFGPNIKILDEAISLHKLNIGKMINNASDLSRFFSLLNNSDKLNSLKKSTLQFVKENSKSSDRVMGVIFK